MNDAIRIEQWQQYECDDWWAWAVWIEGSPEALDEIEEMEWTLHPTFPDPVRRVRNRAEKFRLETGGRGTFRIRARAQLRGAMSILLVHELSLQRPDGSVPKD